MSKIFENQFPRSDQAKSGRYYQPITHPMSPKNPFTIQRQFGTNPSPFLGFVFFCVIMNPLLFFLIESMRPASSLPLLFVPLTGWLLGEIILLNVISGLGGRHWFNGFALANVLGLTGAMLIVVLNIRPDWNGTVFSSFFCLPAAVLIASLPHLAMRLIRSWRISDSDQAPASIRIEDYFILMAVLGSSIALCRAHHVIGSVDRLSEGFIFADIGFMWLYLGVQGFLINLFSLPAIVIAFRPLPFVIRLLLTAAYSVLVGMGLILVMLIMAGASGGAGGMNEAFLYVLGMIGMTSLVVNVGIQFLRLSGFWLWSRRDDRISIRRLSKPEKPIRETKSAVWPVASKEQVIDPFSDDAESVAEFRATRTGVLDGSQLLARWLTVSLVILALFANLIAISYSF